MVKKQLTCFTDNGLYSKKQFLFDDSLDIFKIPLNIINFLCIDDMDYRIKKIGKKKQLKYTEISMFISDLLTALFHCYFLDRHIIMKSIIKMDEKNKKIIIECNSGYSSAHHLFPSGWKDVDDENILRDMLFIIIPFLSLNLLNKNNDSAFLIYAILYQLQFSGLTHKYAHEQNHGRHVLHFIKKLQKNGFAISGKKHSEHHKKLYCNYPFLNGISNDFTNVLINAIDKIFGLKPFEDVIDLCKKYKKNMAMIVLFQ